MRTCHLLFAQLCLNATQLPLMWHAYRDLSSSVYTITACYYNAIRFTLWIIFGYIHAVNSLPLQRDLLHLPSFSKISVILSSSGGFTKHKYSYAFQHYSMISSTIRNPLSLTINSFNLELIQFAFSNVHGTVGNLFPSIRVTACYYNSYPSPRPDLHYPQSVSPASLFS